MTDQADNGNNEGKPSVDDTPKDEGIKLTKEEHAALMEAVKERDTLKAHKEKFEADKKEQVAKKEAERLEAERKAAEKAGDWQKVLEMKDAEIAKLQSQWEENQKAQALKEKQSAIDEVANSLAKELAKTHAGRQKDLANKLASKIDLKDGKPVVVNDKGEIVSDKVETLADFAKKEWDWLVDGIKSSGSAGVAPIKPTGNDQIRQTPLDRLIKANGG